MNRAAFLGSAVAATGTAILAGTARAAESDISVQTSTGTLHGTLSLPVKTPAPVVLIIAGSGPTDRDGNSSLGIRPNTYRLLAAALAQRGVASLRYDKRGIGASASALTTEKDVTFDTFVQDAQAWLQLLRGDRHSPRLTVAGHSEGSLIGMIAIQQVAADAFVSLDGAGRPAPVLLREQLKRNAPPDLLSESDAIIAQLQRGLTVQNIPAQLEPLFRPSVQPFLISWFRYDPSREIAKLRVRATIVQGTADVQVSVLDARTLKDADPGAQLVIVDGMNHLLKYAPDTSSQSAILQGYENASLPVDPHAVDAVVTTATG